MATPLPPQGQAPGGFPMAIPVPDANGGPGGPPGAGPDSEPKDPATRISDALDEIRGALSADGFSEQDRLTLEKVTTLLQGMKATHEKQQQAALGGGPATEFLRRASGN